MPSVSIGSAGQVNVATEQVNSGPESWARLDADADGPRQTLHDGGRSFHDERKGGRGEPQNARKSTRPGRPRQGPARLNAVKHGGLSPLAVLPRSSGRTSGRRLLQRSPAPIRRATETVLAGWPSSGGEEAGREVPSVR